MYPQHLKSTIFGTIKDDVTGATTKISIFNSSIKDMKENLSNGQGVFYSIFQGNKLNDNDVQGILNYVKAIESGVDPAEALKTNITGCSVAAQKYVNDATVANKTTEQITAGLKDAATVGNGFKGVVANITSALGNMVTGMLAGFAIQLAINTIITAFDNLVNAYKKSMEEMSNYQSNISSLKSEAESLNKELKDTKEKIAAIESINPTKLNLFDEAELQRLKVYNDELERKLRLNKAQLEVDAKSADKTAKWTYANSQVDFNPINKYIGENANAQAYSRNNSHLVSMKTVVGIISSMYQHTTLPISLL